MSAHPLHASFMGLMVTTLRRTVTCEWNTYLISLFPGLCSADITFDSPAGSSRIDPPLGKGKPQYDHLSKLTNMTMTMLPTHTLHSPSQRLRHYSLKTVVMRVGPSPFINGTDHHERRVQRPLCYTSESSTRQHHRSGIRISPCKKLTAAMSLSINEISRCSQRSISSYFG